jgi:Na+-driven multidrug efflux pump
MNAFHQTAMNFMGQNTGARKYENFSKILWICLLSVGGVGILLGGGCYLFADSLLSIYITDSAQAVAYGVTRMSFVCVLYFLCGLMDVMSGMLRGMGSSLLPMAVTVLGVCGMRLGWIYTIFRMEQFHTLESLYISYPISWVLTFVALLIGFLVLKKRMMKKAELVPRSAQ